MVRHWLETPPEGYLGSPYGSDVKSLLQRPQTDDQALSQFIEKMYVDLPILSILPAGAVRVWTESLGVDRVALRLDVVGELITVGGEQ